MSAAAERYLIVSLGSIGRRHLRNLRALKPSAVIGVLRQHSTPDALPEGADAQFTDLNSALDFAPRAAIVAGPANTHVQVCKALVGAGIRVLTEKPLSNRLQDALELATLAREKKIDVTVGYNLRFLPSLQEARRLVQDGAIGQVRMVRAEVGQYLPDWRPGQDYKATVSAQVALGGGALLELSHEVDYLCWTLGMPARVSARGGSIGVLDIEAEEVVELCLEYDQPKMLLNVHLDFLQRTPTRLCKFMGEHGTLVWNGIEDRLDLYRADTGLWTQVETPKMNDRNLMYVEELGRFLDAGTDPLACDLNQGLQVMSVVDAARESMKTNAPIAVHHHAEY